jgi:hypothetical protein
MSPLNRPVNLCQASSQNPIGQMIKEIRPCLFTITVPSLPGSYRRLTAVDGVPAGTKFAPCLPEGSAKVVPLEKNKPNCD